MLQATATYRLLECLQHSSKELYQLSSFRCRDRVICHGKLYLVVLSDSNNGGKVECKVNTLLRPKSVLWAPQTKPSEATICPR